MLVTYVVNYEIYTDISADEGDSPEHGEEVSDVGPLAEVLRSVVRLYGIVPHAPTDAGVWWGSNHPVEDRAYFEKGEQKYYTFHILSPVISARNKLRINNMLRSLW